jgi:hypothetical protein
VASNCKGDPDGSTRIGDAQGLRRRIPATQIGSGHGRRNGLFRGRGMRICGRAVGRRDKRFSFAVVVG